MRAWLGPEIGNGEFAVEVRANVVHDADWEENVHPELEGLLSVCSRVLGSIWLECRWSASGIIGVVALGFKARGAVGILSTYLEHFEVRAPHGCGI